MRAPVQKKAREQLQCILTQNDTIISNLLKGKIDSPVFRKNG